MVPKQARGTFRKHITKPSEQVAAPTSTVTESQYIFEYLSNYTFVFVSIFPNPGMQKLNSGLDHKLFTTHLGTLLADEESDGCAVLGRGRAPVGRPRHGVGVRAAGGRGRVHVRHLALDQLKLADALPELN